MPKYKNYEQLHSYFLEILESVDVDKINGIAEIVLDEADYQFGINNLSDLFIDNIIHSASILIGYKKNSNLLFKEIDWTEIYEIFLDQMESIKKLYIENKVSPELILLEDIQQIDVFIDQSKKRQK